MKEAVIVSAARTPFGRYGGGLKSLKAPELGGLAIKEAIERAKIAPEIVDEMIYGIVVPAGVGQIPARQAALAAGLPKETPCLTINKVCGSALKAVCRCRTARQKSRERILRVRLRDGDMDLKMSGRQQTARLLLFDK